MGWVSGSTAALTPNLRAYSDLPGSVFHFRRLTPLESSSRITVPEIARRLDVGRLAVYSMLEGGIIPGVRIGRRWIVTRLAYESWERTCGMRFETGLNRQPELMVLN